MPIDAQLNSRLDILVENQGRICSGHGINELKVEIKISKSF
jgi:hypothetical protein